MTVITFEDGRIKEFSGIPPVSIPRNEEIVITYTFQDVVSDVQPLESD